MFILWKKRNKKRTPPPSKFEFFKKYSPWKKKCPIQEMDPPPSLSPLPPLHAWKAYSKNKVIVDVATGSVFW